jgi:hypothetical protein
MVKEALTKAPTTKNPNNEIDYCKTLFFGYLFMKNRGLFNRLAWNDAEEYSVEKLRKNVMNADEKIAQREEEGAKVDKRKKIVVDQKTAKFIAHNARLTDEEKERIVVTSNVSKKSNLVKKTKAVNSIHAKKSNRK